MVVPQLRCKEDFRARNARSDDALRNLKARRSEASGPEVRWDIALQADSCTGGAVSSNQGVAVSPATYD